MEKPPSYEDVKKHFDEHGVEPYIREYYKEISSKDKIVNKFDFHFLIAFAIIFIVSIAISDYFSLSRTNIEALTLLVVPFLLAIFFSPLGYFNGIFKLRLKSSMTQFPLMAKEFRLYITLVYAQIIYFNYPFLKEVFFNSNSISEIFVAFFGVYVFVPFFGILYGTILGITITEVFIPSKLLEVNKINPSIFIHKKKIEDVFDLVIQQIELLLQKSVEYSKSFKDTRFYVIGKEYEASFSIKENILGICVLKRKGRYLFRDEDCINLQNNVEFILENSLRFEKPENVNINNEVLDAFLDYTRPSELYHLVRRNWKNVLIGVGVSISLYLLYSYKTSIKPEHIITLIIGIIGALIALYIERSRK